LQRQFAKEKPNRAWTFLNSAFGLWLLGSVSLAGITFLYQKLDLSYKAAAERKEMQRKVRVELETRFEVAEYYLQLDRAQPCIKKPDQPPTSELTNLMLREANGEDGGAYEQFRGVSATALFSQLLPLEKLENVSESEKLTEHERKILIAREHWKYLAPKLKARTTQPQLVVPLRCDELSKRLGLIAESFR
jgi:hypothetical protein